MHVQKYYTSTAHEINVLGTPSKMESVIVGLESSAGCFKVKSLSKCNDYKVSYT